MKLHGNAALSWSGRRLLAERVVVAGLDADGGGRGGRCQRSLRAQVGWPLSAARASAGLHDRSSAPRRVANRTPEERVAAIVALRRLRFTAAEIAEMLGMPLSTVSGSCSARDGPARPARARAAAPLRALATGRARPHRRQAARPDRGRRRQTRLRRQRTPTSQPTAPTQRANAATPSATSTCTSPSTTTAGSPTPKCSPTRRQRPRSASSPRASPSIARHGIRVERS